MTCGRGRKRGVGLSFLMLRAHLQIHLFDRGCFIVTLSDRCSSAASTVAHCYLHCLPSHCESDPDSSLPALFFTFLLFLWQAWRLSRSWHQPGEHHGYRSLLQPANGKQRFRLGQRASSSLQYSTFRYKCRPARYYNNLCLMVKVLQ